MWKVLTRISRPLLWEGQPLTIPHRSATQIVERRSICGVDDLNDEFDGTAAPNCPECLTPLEVAGTVEHPYWYCPVCRIARVN